MRMSHDRRVPLRSTPALLKNQIHLVSKSLHVDYLENRLGRALLGRESVRLCRCQTDPRNPPRLFGCM